MPATSKSCSMDLSSPASILDTHPPTKT
jgi:hypothetical protein